MFRFAIHIRLTDSKGSLHTAMNFVGITYEFIRFCWLSCSLNSVRKISFMCGPLSTSACHMQDRQTKLHSRPNTINMT